MRKQSLHWAAVGGISAAAGFAGVVGLALVAGEDARAQNAALTINIVTNRAGDFVFSVKNAKITVGQTIKWVAQDAGFTHNLIPQGPKDNFTPVDDFESPETPTLTFDTPAKLIRYQCGYHDTMKGTITVSAIRKRR